MSKDSLKFLIRQNITSNGRQEITGDIMQGVLLEMVDEMADGEEMIKRIRGSTVALGRSIKYGKDTISSEESITNALEQVAQSIGEGALDEVPDGSVTEQKLSTEVREKLNHDNGYWFSVVTSTEESIAEIPQTKAATFKRSTIY